MRVAITGNIGCGKSTVHAHLCERLPNYKGVSVDDMVRSLYQQPQYLEALEAAFGTRDRKELSDQAFACPQFKQRLENFASSWVVPTLNQALEQPHVIVEFPLLYEMPGWAQRFDWVIALGCDEETQRQRVLARDKMSPEKYEQVRAAQLSTAVKAALATAYIDTGTSLEGVKQAVDVLVPDIKRRALWLRCRNFFGSDAIADAVFAAYSESHRAYHNLEHLTELFAALDVHLPALEHGRAVEMAVWFHDFVYSTNVALYPFNEAWSAKALFEQCRDKAPALLARMHDEIMLACEFIVATKSHRIDSPRVLRDPAALQACKLFLDADLSILASHPDRAARYDEEITQEWVQAGRGVPLETFRQGRAKALASFAARPQLYLSQEFAHLDAPARMNLAALVNHWSSNKSQG